MEILTEKDIEILDSILEIIAKKGRVFSNDLPSLKNDYLSKFDEIKSVEYSQYLDILKNYGVAKVDITLDGRFTVHQIEIKTNNFYDQGGFKSIYQKHRLAELRKKELDELEYKKLKWDSQISRFQAKTKWWPLILSVVSLILALIALLLK
jgi:hypothetical protein